MSRPPKFRVAIIGAGVGGLMLAVALSNRPDIQVDIYEAAKELKEVGAGIGVWPRTWDILKKFGLESELAKICAVPQEGVPRVAFQFRKGDEPRGGHTFQSLSVPVGFVSIHRPAFQGVLLDHLSRLPSCRTYTRKRLISYSQGRSSSSHRGPITMFFADGTSTSCDLLVGADGVKSAVRVCMLDAAAQSLRALGQHQAAEEILFTATPKWSGTFAYRASINAALLKSKCPNHRVFETPHVYLGKDSEMTTYPMALGTLVNLAAFRARYDLENTILDGPSVENVSREEFIGDFRDWEPEARVLLDCVQSTSRWAVHTVTPLKYFASGHVALLGDAAHAMMPYQGAGAGQAIEDAYILAKLLCHPSAITQDIPRICEIYDIVRRPFAQYVANVSRDAGILYTLNYPGMTFRSDRDRSTDADKLQEIYRRLVQNWKWAWETTIDGDVQRAVAMFEGRA